MKKGAIQERSLLSCRRLTNLPIRGFFTCFSYVKPLRSRSTSHLPATGPVQAGGDQGRDFETFHTYLSRSSLAGRSFVGLLSETPIQGLHFSPGALLILGAALTESIFFVVQKPYLGKYSGLELTTYTIWTATLFLLIHAPGLAQQVQAAPGESTLAVVYLGLFPAAVAYVNWAYALARTSASSATSFLYLLPVFANLIAWLWLDDLPSVLSLLGERR